MELFTSSELKALFIVLNDFRTLHRVRCKLEIEQSALKAFSINISFISRASEDSIPGCRN